MSKKVNWQMLFSALFLVIALLIVVSITLSDNNLDDTINALRSMNMRVLIGCLLCWCGYVLFDGLSVYHFLRMQGKPIRLWQSAHAAVTGLFYCNVTPGATGGQPMEMYCLKKYGVPIGISGSAMAIKFVVFQTVLLVAGIIEALINRSFLLTYMQGKQWFVLLGYLVNFFSVGMVLMMAISKKAVRWLMNKCIAIATKLHLCKNPEGTRQKWENYCESFLNSMQLIIRHPKDVAIQCLIALGQLLSLMLVVVLLFEGFGLAGYSTNQLITLGVFLYIGASYTPLPGASGAQEGGFAMLFSNVFGSSLFLALLLWRFFTYYLTVLAGVLMTVIENIIALRKARRKKATPKKSSTKSNTAEE